MGTKLSEKEIEIIEDFSVNSKKETLCPRCKKKLKMIEKGSGYVITCGTDNCIKAKFRGL